MASNIIGNKSILALLLLLVLCNSVQTKHRTRSASTDRPTELRALTKAEEFEQMNSYIRNMQLEERVYISGGYSGKGLMGVVFLEKRIYVLCAESRKVLAFSDKYPFNRTESDDIEIESMSYYFEKDIAAKDMAASTTEKSLFISDFNSSCVYQIQLPHKMVRVWWTDGQPMALSITPADELLVLVERKGYDTRLDTYRISDFTRLKSVALPEYVSKPLHVIQTSKGKLLIAYKSVIGEFSADGIPNSINIFQLSSPASYLAIDEADRIFVGDVVENRVLLLDPELKGVQILPSPTGTSFRGPPFRLFYSAPDRRLIVGQQDSKIFSVFNFTKIKN